MDATWEAVVIGGRLQMRRRERGKWVYREPTPEETEHYIKSEAW